MKTKTFATLKKQVERILELYPKTRENDAFLTVYLWKEFYGEFLFTAGDNRLSIRLVSIPHLPSSDSISRARRKIQEDGFYLPENPEVRRKRSQAQDDWKEALGYYS